VAPSEYVPVAVNYRVSPTAKLIGYAGSISIEDKVGAAADAGADVDVVEQAAMTKLKAANNSMVRRQPINHSWFLFIIINSSI
jgi:hypothetical protein